MKKKHQTGEVTLKDIAPEVPPLQKKIRDILAKHSKRQQRLSLIELSDLADCSPRRAEAELGALQEKGFNVEMNADKKFELSSTIPKAESVRLSTEDYFGDDWIRFGFVTDNHLASKYSRLDVVNALYDVFEREGVRLVYNAGNWIDGEARFNKYDLHCVGFENQLNYFLQHYPQRKGIETQIVSGDDHEGWYVQREQINVGRVMQDRARSIGRNDLVDLGYMERDIEYKRGSGRSIIRVIHAGGGSAYAISYTSQKYVESLQGGEKPAVVLVGHYHKFDYSYPREVHVIQGGTTQDQTPFMRKKRIQAMVGGCMVEMKQDRKGVFNRVRVEWIPFYDRKFYSYNWK